MKVKIILTCEHADYKIPTEFKKSVKIPSEILRSHRGWDQGAKSLALRIQKELQCDLFTFDYTRLLVDANRSLHNDAIKKKEHQLDSKKVKKLEKMYLAYENKIRSKIQREINKGNKVYVFAIHSFTPIYKEKIRKTEIGLLFRPNILKELTLANNIKKSLKLNTKSSIHFNLPYRGFTDCLLNNLLDELNNPNLNGLFLEFNQNILTQTTIAQTARSMQKALQALHA